LANTYTFQRRAIYWEEETVTADTVEEAYEKVENGDSDELNIQDFYDYYDDDYELIDEEIADPLVTMVAEYSLPYQYELFENNG
jgi:Ran GTPase-activating protein (RanGAP) involved in mRNA processing and transport